MCTNLVVGYMYLPNFQIHLVNLNRLVFIKTSCCKHRTSATVIIQCDSIHGIKAILNKDKCILSSNSHCKIVFCFSMRLYHCMYVDLLFGVCWSDFSLWFSQVLWLHQTHIHMKNPHEVKEKINKIISGGKNKLQIIFDFDRTLTKHHENGVLTKSSFGKSVKDFFCTVFI